MVALTSPLHDAHLALGGKMVEFGGFLMPLQYTGIIAEHIATRTAAGLFDTSHMGEFLVTGEDAEAFLQQALTNDLARCPPGEALYSPMYTPSGGTVDDLFVYNISGMDCAGALPARKAGHAYMVVVNAANTPKDLAWLRRLLAEWRKEGPRETAIEDIGSGVAMLALQGPQAREILEPLGRDVGSLARFHAMLVDIRGILALVSRTGYTGEDGFELYTRSAHAARLWKLLLDAGKSGGLHPAGLGARDSLRLEACYPLYGHELSEDISPVEGGVGWAVREKNPAGIGGEALLGQKRGGAPRELIALEMERAIARQHCAVMRPDSEDDAVTIGAVTSGTFSPTLGKSIALALTETGIVSTGDEVRVEVRERRIPARVVKRPFYAFAGGRR